MSDSPRKPRGLESYSREKLIETVIELRRELAKSRQRVRQLTLKEDLEDAAQKYSGSFGQWVQSQLIAAAAPTHIPSSDTPISAQSPPSAPVPRSK